MAAFHFVHSINFYCFLLLRENGGVLVKYFRLIREILFARFIAAFLSLLLINCILYQHLAFKVCFYIDFMCKSLQRKQTFGGFFLLVNNCRRIFASGLFQVHKYFVWLQNRSGFWFKWLGRQSCFCLCLCVRSITNQWMNETHPVSQTKHGCHNQLTPKAK